MMIMICLSRWWWSCYACDWCNHNTRVLHLRSTTKVQQAIGKEVWYFQNIAERLQLPWGLVNPACRRASGCHSKRSCCQTGWIIHCPSAGSLASPSCPGASWSSPGCLGTHTSSVFSSGRAWLVCSGISRPLLAGPVVTSVDIWERNKELIRKRTNIGEHFTREII